MALFISSSLKVILDLRVANVILLHCFPSLFPLPLAADIRHCHTILQAVRSSASLSLPLSSSKRPAYRISLVIPPSSLFTPPPPLAADIKHYFTTLQNVHSGADLQFTVGATKWVLEQAGDRGLIAMLDEVRLGREVE